MKILVIVKQTPDTEAKIKIDSSGTYIDTEGIKWIVNPYDEFAIEEAIQIKERLGTGEVTLIAMGPQRIIESLRTGLAMGADKAVHIKDNSFEFTDEYATGKVLSFVIKSLGTFDLILTGKKMIDEETGQVGIQVASDLGIPHVGLVSKIELTDSNKKARCTRRIEGGEVIVEVPLPAILTCERGLNEPRYASLPGIMRAKKKEVKEIGVGDIDVSSIGLTREALGRDGSRMRITGFEIPKIERRLYIIKKDPQEAAAELVRLLREEAKVI